MKKLAILGASGHGKVVADLAELLGYDCFFYDDAWPNKSQLSHWPIIGDTDGLTSKVHEYDGVIIAIGHNETRCTKQKALSVVGAHFPVLVHPSAVISQYASLGSGTVAFAGVVVNADAKVKQGVILNTNCTVDHDCTIGSFSHISPGANLAGGVSVGSNAWLGIGAVVKQLVTVGSDAVVGMGAVVTKDVPAGATVVGNPAKPLIKNS